MHEHVRDELHRFEIWTGRIEQRKQFIHFFAKNRGGKKHQHINDDEIKCYAFSIYIFKHVAANVIEEMKRLSAEIICSRNVFLIHH